MGANVTDRLGVALGSGTPARRAANWLVAVAGFVAVLEWFWPVPLGVVLFGVLVGSLTALGAFGMALVYRANRVVNFAQADLGVLPATVFSVLFAVKLWSYWASLTGGLLVAIVLGLVVERVVVRWFSRSPRLMLTVATLGLSQLLSGSGAAVPSSRLVPRTHPFRAPLK